MKILAFLFLAVRLSCSFSAHADVYSDDWKAFVKEIDQNHPFLKLKKIDSDWKKAKKELGKRVDDCKSDEEFLLIVTDACKTLRDAHMGFRETKVPLPPPQAEYCLSVAFMPATENRVVVMGSAQRGPASVLKPGTVILAIDGQPARAFLNRQALEMWNEGGGFSSSQRAAMLAYRRPLSSPDIKDHSITYLDNGKKATVTLRNDSKYRSWLHTYNQPEGLTAAEGECSHTCLPDQIGYLYIRRMQMEQTAKGVLAAIKACPDARGWIVDLRGNGGGGYGKPLIEAFGQLKKPVVVIIDAGCISAGETVIRDLKQQTGATIIGQTSAGSSTAKKTWDFPSGIASMILSTRSRYEHQGNMIEFNGVKPEIPLEPVPEEVAQGKNSEILRAGELILKAK